MTDLLGDLRAAIRQWTRRPSLPLIAGLTLAVGLGLAIGAFSVTWAVAWRPLDVPEPERLVWIESDASGEADSSSPGAALRWQEEARTLDAVGLSRSVAGVLSDELGTDRLPGAFVSATVFDVLSLRPVVGRGLTAGDDRPGAARVLMLSHRAWQSRYGGSASVVGRTVSLDGRPADIVGVLPPNADLLLPHAEWWAPIAFAPSERDNVGPRYLDVIGRLAAHASPAAAQQELAAITARLALKADDGTPLGVRVTTVADHLAAPHRRGLVLLLAAVITLVLIACANVAGLLLTAAHDRAPELALRASLGASPRRIRRQLLVESALLAAAASAAGLLLALWVTAWLRNVLPADTPRLAETRVDGVAVVFALGAGVMVTMLAGLFPAIRGARTDLQSVLRGGVAGGTGSEHTRRLFVVGQVALAMVLTCAGALLVRTSWALERAPRGYEATGAFTTSITLPGATYRDPAAISGVIDQIVRGAAEMPGVVAAAAASQLPFGGGSAGSDVALAEETFSDGVDRQVRVRLVGPGYVNALGISLRAGREVTAADGPATLPVVLVNETMARRLTPGGSPVGRYVKFGVPVFNGADGNRVWQVVGVAADTWDRGPRVAVEPEVLIPLAQTPAEVFFWISRELQLAIRTQDVRNIGPAIRRVINSADPAIAIGPVQALDDQLAESFARERLLASLLAALGLAGVALALLGLYSVVHNQVHRRRRDIAIRMALGATRHVVTSSLVTRGTQLALLGAAVGGVASLGTGGLLASLLFGVTPGDPATLAGVAVAVVGLAALAAWVPARHASRVDPAEALRS